MVCVCVGEAKGQITCVIKTAINQRPGHTTYISHIKTARQAGFSTYKQSWLLNKALISSIIA